MAKPPVVKIIDYGKFKYEQQKKATEAKKKQVTVQLKEIQFRPNIETHDLETKLKRAEKFIAQGDKVKMVMQFRGREMAYKEQGLDKFRSIILNVEEIGAIVESPMKMMGNRAITILAPSKKAPKKDKPAESVSN
jgi:translation initiation factor IF-3